MAAEVDEDVDEMEDRGRIRGGPEPLGLGIRMVCWVDEGEDDDDGGRSSLTLFIAADVQSKGIHTNLLRRRKEDKKSKCLQY